MTTSPADWYWFESYIDHEKRALHALRRRARRLGLKVHSGWLGWLFWLDVRATPDEYDRLTEGDTP